MKYIVETASESQVTTEILVEAVTGAKKYYLTGIFSEADTVNRNGRKYPKAVIEKAVNEYKSEYINNNIALGNVGHPDHLRIDFLNAACLVESLEWKGNELHGRCRILDTPAGKTIQALIEAGVRVGISSRGAGDVSEANGHKEVKNLKLIAFDLVESPSCQKAYLSNIMESKEFTLIENQLVEVTPEILDKLGYMKKVVEETKQTPPSLDEDKIIEQFQQLVKNLEKSVTLKERVFKDIHGSCHQRPEREIALHGKTYNTMVHSDDAEAAQFLRSPEGHEHVFLTKDKDGKVLTVHKHQLSK
jgi:hypothetical protein